MEYRLVLDKAKKNFNILHFVIKHTNKMGNEAGTFANIGKCCASEEIEEVIKRDGTQTLSFDAGNTTADVSPDGKTKEERNLANLGQH